MTYFLVGLSFLLYIKYLCGYEYITTITVMSMSVVSYFLYLNKSKLKDYIKNFMLVGAVSIFAFAGALTTHVYSLNSYTGSTKNSIKVIKNTAHERISSSDTYKNYVYDSTQRSLESHYRITDTYFHYENRKQSKSLSIAILVSIVNYALLPVINIPLTLNQPFAIYAQSTFLFIIVLVLLYIKRKSWVKKPEVGKIEALFMAAATGLVGSISWYIAANSHSLVHAHINGILVYLPFALFGYIIIGVWIENSVKKIRRNA